MMKRLIVIVAILSLTLSMGNLAFAGAKGTGLAGDYHGQGKFDSDPQRVFRLVRFLQDGGSDSWFTNCEISEDSIVVWNLTDDDGVTVSLTTSSNVPYVAGVLATTCDSETTNNLSNTAVQDIGKDNWAWMQTYGLCTFINDGAAAFAEGDAVGTGVRYGEVGRFVASTAAGNNNGFAGFAYGPMSPNGIFQGFIRTE